MSIAGIEKNDPSRIYYNLKNKLYNHVMMRSEEAFKRANKRRENIKSAEDLKNYAKEMKLNFAKNLGGIPYDKNLPLNAKITGVIEEEGLKIEKIIFESRPKVYVTANLYIPEKRKNPCGAVLFQIGHAEEGKTAVQYQKVARAICSAGLIVMIMDPVGQGERLSYFEPEISTFMIPPTIGEHQYTGEQCVLIGDSIARYFIADAMRAIDYLSSRPEVDSEKIGATGSSGGGTATCHLMVCDDRIKAAAPGTFVTSRREYFYSGNAQDSEQIWMNATKEGFDHHEVLACFAPKPLMLLTVDSDFFPIEGADEVFASGKRFWEMFGEKEELKMVKDTSQHKYTDNLAVSAAEFFAKALNGEEKSADREKMKSLPQGELLCTKSGQVKTDFPDCKFYFDENLERYRAITKPQKPFKEFLQEKMNYERQKSELRLRTLTPVYENGLKIVPYMWFSQPQMPNFGLMFSDFRKKAEETVICLWDKGTDDIETHIYKIRELIKENKNVFVLDLSGAGKCAPNTLNLAYDDKSMYGVIDKLSKDLFYLGDSLCALRLYELDFAVKMLKESFNTSVSIFSEGMSANLMRLYKVIEPCICAKEERGAMDFKEIVETKYYESYNISGYLLPGVIEYLK